MKTLQIALIFIFLNAVVIAGNDKEGNETSDNTATTTIRGKIIDKATNEALTGVKVVLEETGEVVYTDFDGNFSFENLPKSSYKICTSYVSYEDKKIDCNTTKEKDLNIKLDNTL